MLGQIESSGFRDKDLGLRDQGSGFWSLGFGVLGFQAQPRVWGLGFWSLAFRVLGFGV